MPDFLFPPSPVPTIKTITQNLLPQSNQLFLEPPPRPLAQQITQAAIIKTLETVIIRYVTNLGFPAVGPLNNAIGSQEHLQQGIDFSVTYAIQQLYLLDPGNPIFQFVQQPNPVMNQPGLPPGVLPPLALAMPPMWLRDP